MATVEILTLAAPRLGAGDLATVERLVRESGTWALVDGLAVNVAGEIALRDPRSWPVIDGWAADADFWVRRSALLALLRGIRAGRPDLPRFTRYAEPMLAEREFFIRKAIGWVLREISKHDPDWVASWTQRHLLRDVGGDRSARQCGGCPPRKRRACGHCVDLCRRPPRSGHRSRGLTAGPGHRWSSAAGARRGYSRAATASTARPLLARHAATTAKPTPTATHSATVCQMSVHGTSVGTWATRRVSASRWVRISAAAIGTASSAATITAISASPPTTPQGLALGRAREAHRGELPAPRLPPP